jgi:hypothetical protein
MNERSRIRHREMTDKRLEGLKELAEKGEIDSSELE